MRIYFIAFVLFVLVACAGTPVVQDTNIQEANISVSSLLDEIQIAINDIDKKTGGSSLPPFQSATIRLNTVVGKEVDGGGASLMLSANASKQTTNSNTLTLELVPNPNLIRSESISTGKVIANTVVSAIKAIDQDDFLKLKALTVEAGINVRKTSSGGIDIQLIGISIGASSTNTSSSSHTLKLFFAYPN